MDRRLLKLIPKELKEAVEFDKTYFNIQGRDCSEVMVNVKDLITKTGLIAQFNSDPTITSQERLFFLRKNVALSLCRATKGLNSLGFIPKFEYMYRRLEDQEGHFRRSVNNLLQQYPNLNDQTLVELAGVFVAANPNTSAHISGAAVDVTLLDKNQEPLDMGCAYLHSGPESKTESLRISKVARKNRSILKSAMENVGFSNYPFEYWHYSMGDKIAARVSGTKVIYGPVLFDAKTGKVKSILNGESIFNVSDLVVERS